MSLSDYAKTAALRNIEAIWRAAAPKLYIGEGSEIRHIFMMPLATIQAALQQELASLENLYLGRPELASEQDYDLIASNIPGGGNRPQGAPSATTQRVYLRRAVAIGFDATPYFRTLDGRQFAPISPIAFQPTDVRKSPTGELYVDVPVVCIDYGVDVGAGEITLFTNLPPDVTRTENIAPAVGSRARFSNDEYFAYLQATRSDNTKSQVGGMLSYVQRLSSEILEASVVAAGDAAMLRDEIFTTNDVTPNFDREGYPMGVHTYIGVVDADAAYGRLRAASDIFTQEMVGRRIALVGDRERYRLIQRVIDAKEIIVSGGELYGSMVARVWGDGPRTRRAADVYVYLPRLHARSQVIDRRRLLQTTKTVATTDTKIYYTVLPGRTYASIPDEGPAIVLEGSANARRVEVVGRGEDADGSYLTLSAQVGAGYGVGTRLSLYPSSAITIGEQGDISQTPVLYVADVEQLDPNTLEPVASLPATVPGPYAAPGYYISTPDAALVFGAREEKELVLDAKRDFNSFVPLSINNASIIESSQVGSRDLIQRSGIDFAQMEGRQVTLLVPERQITQSNILAAIVTGVTPTTLTFADAFVQYFTEDGWRSGDITVSLSSATALFTPFSISNCRMRGNTLERLDGGVFVGDMMDYDPAAIAFAGSISKPAYEAQGVIVRGDMSEFEVLVSGGLSSVDDEDQTLTVDVGVELADERGSFDAAPLRVTYFTHPDILEIQEDLESGVNRGLCTDTQVRSFMPALIDITLEYRGQTPPATLKSRFIQLLQDAVMQTDDTEQIQIDVSDVLAALNTEGFASAFQPDFEVKVTEYLSDGEAVVRYLNPAPATRMEMALAMAVFPGASRIQVRNARSAGAPPSRGKVVLGGLNPTTREVLPYEAVIANDDGTYTLILRGTLVTSYIHAAWESALVGVRDWEPELEYTNSVITISATSRPYLRQGIFIRRI